MRHLILFLISFCVLVSSANAESVKSLKRKQQEAKKNIELTNKLLNETQKDQKSTVSNLTVLKKQIQERENLIQALNSEITVMDATLDKLTVEKMILERRLTALQNEYANLVYHAYFFKNKYNQYLFVFSSESFSQAYRRWRYVQQYSQYRKDQTIQIRQVAVKLKEKENQVINAKKEKAVVLNGKEKENQKLQSDRASKQRMLSDLTKKEKDLKKKLKKEQANAERLNKQIEDLIAKEIAAAEKRRKEKEAAERAKKGSTQAAPTSNGMSKEEGLIAGGFEKNKGRLPWPCKGVVTGHFGIHPHPVLQHVQINNKGVYIKTQPQSDAHAVYEGEVTQVFAIPGSNNAIIVKHGNYRTVYANLTTTYVKVGSKVQAKEALGKIYVDEENDNKTELYFMLYKNADLTNPELWLSK